MVWTPTETDLLLNNYKALTMSELSKLIGKTEDSIRGKKERLFLSKINKENLWSDEEITLLKNEYSDKNKIVDLDKLQKVIGKHKTNISRKARELGLTNHRRHKKGIKSEKLTLICLHCNTPFKVTKKDINKKFCSNDCYSKSGIRHTFNKTPWANRPHPKGMLGKKHSKETIDVLKTIVNNRIKSGWKFPKKTQEQLLKLSKASVEKMKGINAYSRTKKGWVSFGNKKIFCKSSWEMNYACYLEWLKSTNNIIDWQYEPDTFWFEKIRRGVRSYTPDFKVTNKTGDIEYHEVKGWMDSKSKTKLKRMKIYHPSIKLIVIDKTPYTALKKQLGNKIMPY